MGIEAVLDQALDAFGGNQTQLAEALGVKGPTVNRWRLGKSGIDYESCLRLARVTGLPAATVLRAASRDPSLLPAGDPESPTESRTELARMRRLFNDLKSVLAQLDGNAEIGRASNDDYVWQEGRRLWAVPSIHAPLMFPFLGDLFQQCPA